MTSSPGTQQRLSVMIRVSYPLLLCQKSSSTYRMLSGPSSARVTATVQDAVANVLPDIQMQPMFSSLHCSILTTAVGKTTLLICMFRAPHDRRTLCLCSLAALLVARRP
jgi:hypothetical protein